MLDMVLRMAKHSPMKASRMCLIGDNNISQILIKFSKIENMLMRLILIGSYSKLRF
jgi:hypothetical protein